MGPTHVPTGIATRVGYLPNDIKLSLGEVEIKLHQIYSVGNYGQNLLNFDFFKFYL